MAIVPILPRKPIGRKSDPNYAVSANGTKIFLRRQSPGAPLNLQAFKNPNSVRKHPYLRHTPSYDSSSSFCRKLWLLLLSPSTTNTYAPKAQDSNALDSKQLPSKLFATSAIAGKPTCKPLGNPGLHEKLGTLRRAIECWALHLKLSYCTSPALSSPVLNGSTLPQSIILYLPSATRSDSQIALRLGTSPLGRPDVVLATCC